MYIFLRGKRSGWKRNSSLTLPPNSLPLQTPTTGAVPRLAMFQNQRSEPVIYNTMVSLIFGPGKGAQGNFVSVHVLLFCAYKDSCYYR